MREAHLVPLLFHGHPVIHPSIYPFFKPPDALRERDSIASHACGLGIPAIRPPVLPCSPPPPSLNSAQNSSRPVVPLSHSLSSSPTVTWLPTDTYLSLPLTFDMNNVCQVSTQPPPPPHLLLPLSATAAAGNAAVTFRRSLSANVAHFGFVRFFGRSWPPWLSHSLSPSPANGKPSARPRHERRGREVARLPADQVARRG